MSNTKFLILFLIILGGTFFQCVPKKESKAIVPQLGLLTLIERANSVQELLTIFSAEDIRPDNQLLATAKKTLWEKYKTDLHTDSLRRLEYQDKSISFNGKTMRYAYKKIGKKPTTGYPLYIALHGGGGAPASLNDSQWEHMQRFYLGSVKNGIYLAVRGITNTWNLHFVNESYPLYDRLIENMIAFEGIDPNRVYFMGFSAGGDGVYQVVPRMADRFAAANMSAGHPNGVSLVNLYHVPFLIQVGELDDAYNRNKVSVEYGQQLKALKAKHPNGYHHHLFVHWNKTHSYVQDHNGKNNPVEVIANPYEWLKDKALKKKTFQDADAIGWMSQHTRNPYPEHLIWDLNTQATMRDGVAQTGENLWQTPHRSRLFYWLDAGTLPQNKDAKIIDIQYVKKNNLIQINKMGAYVKVLLNQKMLDLSKPITIKYGEQEKLVTVQPSMKTVVSSLLGRGDVNYVFEAAIEVTFQNGKFLVRN